MKIYKILQMMDGGPNDSGTLCGFVKAESQEDARIRSEIKPSFFKAYVEISNNTFKKLKKESWNNYLMFKNIT
jgi:hypothetical protein